MVDASLKTAYDNICKVSEWWGTIEGPTHQPGDEFTFSMGTTWVKFRITEMIPEKKIVWDVLDCYLPFIKDLKEWNGTTVVWNIKRNGELTEIDFEHIGLTPEVECYDNCEKGWNFYVNESLKKLITDGVGMPAGRTRN